MSDILFTKTLVAIFRIYVNNKIYIKHSLILPLIILLFFTFLGCKSQPPRNDIHTIDIDLNNCEKIYMSDLFSDIDYIPLETNDSCLVGSISQRIKIIGNYIYTIEFEKVLRFHINGKFDKVIIKQGRGPDQIFAPRDVAVSKKYIYVLGMFETVVLDLNGTIIKRIRMPEMSESIYCFPDGDLLIYHGITINTSNGFKAGIYDENIKLKKLFWPIPKYKNNGGTGLRIHPDGKRVFLTNLSADTIFNLTNKRTDPVLKINFGQYARYDGKILMSPHMQDLIIKKHIWLFSYLHYFNPGIPIQFKLIYNEKKNTYLLTKDYIINDMDSGLGFAPFLTHNLNDDNYLYSTIEPFEILNRINVEKEKGMPPVSNKFFDLSNKITQTSNIVIMKCTIKEL